MTTEVMKNTTNKGLITLVVVMGAVIIGLIAGLVATSQERDKYKAILDLACDYSYNTQSCKQGMKYLKGMDTSAIKDLGR